MKSWRIFKHSIKQLIGNWKTVLRIVLPALLLSLALDAFVSREIIFLSVDDVRHQIQWIASTYHGEKLLEIYAAAFIKLILGLWVAITWHRYVLLNEIPSIPPKFRGKRISAYFLKGILVTLPAFLLVLPIILPIIILSMLYKSPNTEPVTLIFILLALIFIAAFIIILRLSTLLPGAALGKSTSMLETWRITSGETKVFAGLSVVMILLTLAFSAANYLMPDIPFIIALAWQNIAVYLQTVIILSMLTTLYGHYIERRSLIA
ncbi:hypothetical protein [Agrobacterium vitis]|uniref:hypothetical protein n=1 Tax=Agrobacterium vitis TaxID=373 RepID=UPI0015D7467B|nr:hypothetical protein [Agrobacterium vitis]